MLGITKIRVFVLLSVVFTNSISYSFGDSLPVVPGENVNLYGMSTPAGSGRHLQTPTTTICKVTNLNDSGVGSLRDCLVNVASPKTIIFEVSGSIELQSSLRIGGFTGKLCDGDPATQPDGIDYDTGNYITIAGQTAPPPGITIRNHTFMIERSCHDILIQHLRFRVGDDDPTIDNAEYLDAMVLVGSYVPEAGWYPPKNIVIDHNSFSWAIDETVETGADNISFINNIFSEGLSRSIHPKGEHSKGLVATGYGITSQNVFVGKNLFTHNGNRNPKVSSGNVVFSNNLIFDIYEGIKLESIDATKAPVLATVTGNYIKGTHQTVRSIYLMSRYETHPETRFFVDTNNYFGGKVQTDPLSTVAICGNFGAVDGCAQPLEPQKIATTAPIWPIDYSPMSALDAKGHVLNNAGAWPANRDTVDTRIVNEVIAGNSTPALVDCVACTNSECTAAGVPRFCCTGAGTGDCIAVPGGWPTFAENSRAHTTPTNPNQIQPSGYTKLETWLHGFSCGVEGKICPPSFPILQ